MTIEAPTRSSAPRAPRRREDLACRSLAEAHGWTEVLHVFDREAGRLDTPHFPLGFSKGDKRMWLCRRGWACADLTGDGSSVSVQYRNHRYYPLLETALTTES